MKLKYFGSIKDGLIKLPKRVRKEVLSRFNGHNIIVTFERKRKTRSNPQNSYYQGVVLPEIVLGMIELGNELQLGNKEDHESVHLFLKDRFLQNGKDFLLKDGLIETGSSSTKYCTTTEFMTYLDDVVKFASEYLNISIPEPNEQVDFNF